MRFDKFTLKNQEAVQKAVELAQELGHQQLEPEHVAVALIHDAQGIVGSLLAKIGISFRTIIREINARSPKAS
jgi:ATP-dependent Clp protease ATP-binding subunit ClpB